MNQFTNLDMGKNLQYIFSSNSNASYPQMIKEIH